MCLFFLSPLPGLGAARRQGHLGICLLSWNPACIWYSYHSPSRDFQILMAEPFPPPKLSLQGTQSGVGKPGIGEWLRGQWRRDTQAGECGRGQQGRCSPPGAGHRPYPCASAGCASQTTGSSFSSAAASAAPQGPAGHKRRARVLAGACALHPILLCSHVLPESSPQRSPFSRSHLWLPWSPHSPSQVQLTSLECQPHSMPCSHLTLKEDRQGSWEPGIRTQMGLTSHPHSSPAVSLWASHLLL